MLSVHTVGVLTSIDSENDGPWPTIDAVTAPATDALIDSLKLGALAAMVASIFIFAAIVSVKPGAVSDIEAVIAPAEVTVALIDSVNAGLLAAIVASIFILAAIDSVNAGPLALIEAVIPPATALEVKNVAGELKLLYSVVILSALFSSRMVW